MRFFLTINGDEQYTATSEPASRFLFKGRVELEKEVDVMELLPDFTFSHFISKIVRFAT